MAEQQQSRQDLISKTFEAKAVEGKWQERWQQQSLFRADPSSDKPPFCLVMPPPNVTGVLHMGHALVTTLQDVMVRWKRMTGHEVLWVPGTDHAGISTQTVVERHLIATRGKKRRDFSREDFLAHVWAWKEQSETRIVEQLKCLGSSCDWSRQRFTMDAGNNRAVRVMFKKLYDAGLIYKGDYLVNWDPVTQTAISDDEVEYEERNSFLWTLRYPLRDRPGHVSVATTRPETMLGDTAVAVSPKDSRYADLIGAVVSHPLTGRQIPIVSDPFVDPTFGTGAVKITPAHDPNDYQLALRHGLPFLNIMTPDGRLNEQAGPFAGLTMQQGRDAVIQALREQGLLEKTAPHLLRVGISYRSKAVIEPYLSKQWFIRMEPFKDKLRSAVTTGAVRLIPQHWDNVYCHWIDNLRDWCISRQLWWGHRIPIWSHVDDPERHLCFEGEGEPEEVQRHPEQWVREEDVLDTWFSSSLWPFSTLGWPEATPEMRTFYPNSLLITGHDILFFWVARMLMMGQYATGQLPFPKVFLHGLIYGKSYWRDAAGGGVTYCSAEERRAYDLGAPVPDGVQMKWEKMSKSKGNVIDPLEIIDTYGTDAMRMALCASATQARQIDLDRRRFEEFRNFANKIWNGARFVLMNLEGDNPLTAADFSKGIDETLLALEDRWLLSILGRTVREVNQHLENTSFDQAAIEAYDFFWKEFCAYYVEMSKPILFGKQGTPAHRSNKQKLLVIALCQAVRLLHPITPFITEELFQILKERLSGVKAQPEADPYTAECVQALQAEACAVAPYPQLLRAADLHPEIEATFKLVEDVIYAVRNIRGEMKVPPAMATDIVLVVNASAPQCKVLKDNVGLIASLVRVNQITVADEDPHLPYAATGVVGPVRVIIPLPPELLKQEKSRLSKEQARLAASLAKLSQQLDNQAFVAQAPAELVAKQRELHRQTQGELDVVVRKLEALD